MSKSIRESSKKHKRARELFSAAELSNIRELRSSWAKTREGSLIAVDLWRRVGPPEPRHLLQRSIPDDQLFARLAGLAQIPERNITRFRKCVSYELDKEWIRFRHWPEPIDPTEGKIALKQLRLLKRASANLREVVASLNDQAIIRIRIAMTERMNYKDLPTRDEFVQFARVFSNFADCSARALYWGEMRPDPSGRGPGRPPGSALTRGWSGEIVPFALRLLWDVAALGGRLTLNKNTREGTFLDSLLLLEPFLPPEFITKPLPISVLSRLKTVEAKLADESQI